MFGFDDASTFSFRQPWPWAVLLIALAVGYVVLLYGRERGLAGWQRVLLGTLRAALYALLILLLFEPVVAITKSITVPGNVLVLVDVSESMGLRDDRQRPEDVAESALALGELGFRLPAVNAPARPEVTNASRLDLARGILQHPELTFFRQPDPRYRLWFLAFGERLEPVADDPDVLRAWLGSAQPSARATRLGEALQEAVERYRGQPVAAVVVLTDGASNEGTDPREAARTLGVPVYPVGLGLPEPDDVRVEAVVVAEAVFPGDRVPVRVQLAAGGVFARGGRSVAVVLSADGRELDRRAVTLAGPSQLAELAFVPEPGRGTLKLEVSVPPLAGEASTANNRAVRSVKVIDEKIKVLYVEGKPRWEFRYLRAVLLRDPRLDVKFLLTEGDHDLARASGEYLARFPVDETEALRYDLVILGDVPASFFTAAQLDWLEMLVRAKGGSFLLLAGQDFAPMTYLDTPVARLLPVRLAAGGREPVDAAVHPVVTAAGRESLMMALTPESAQDPLVWERVRPLYAVPRLDGRKPGATVLATLSDRDQRGEPYPLIAWPRYGSGKVMYVGTDQLWRLRFKTGDQYHARFWGQAVQFLTLSRLLGANKRIRLELERTTCRTGERVAVYANVLDETFQPVKADGYTVFVASVPPQGEPRPVTLRPVSDAPGLYQGAFTANQPGTFQLQPRLEDEAHANTVAFEVFAANVEQLEPAMQQETLRKVAELSKGEYLTVRDLPRLPDLIRVQPQTVPLPPQEVELWDWWVILVVVIACAGTEWFLRRRFDAA